MKWIQGFVGVLALWSGMVSAALKPGDEVSLEAVTKSEFLKGEAPKEWEPGKVYVVECWATWCGPCIAAIPHVNELYTKYKDKGLRVLGMNVWEDDKETVKGFVDKKGDGMSYAVAFVGKDGPFAKDWLEAADVSGIPHAFVVKEGKLLFSTHPANLSEEMVEDLLAGGEKEKAVVEKIADQEKQQQEQMEKAMAEQKARQERLGDFEEKMEQFANEKKSDEMLKLVEETLATKKDLTPGDKAHVLMGKLVAYMLAQKEEEAIAAVDEIIKADPESPMAGQEEMIKAQVKAQIEKFKEEAAGDKKSEE